MLFAMSRATVLVAIIVVIASIGEAFAQNAGVNALVDFGAVLPSAERSFMKGGLGKLEFGGGRQQPLVSGQALADLWAKPDPALDAFATLRLAPDQHAPFDLLEAYGRYRPVMTPNWLWTVKAGAFYPPVSLENEGVGWTSPWTLTSSAINSWVGDELRTIGGETSVEWRHETGSVGLTGAVFGANDPAGTLLADRGWAFDSRPMGLLAEVRRPDAMARQLGRPTPIREQPFQEIDGAPGWYAGAMLRQDGIGRFAALHYDNRADPGLFSGGDFGWRTRFTSFGAEFGIGDIVFLSQAMFGDTTIEPVESLYIKTNFQSAYLLAGYYFDDFRVAARIDVFATQQNSSKSGKGPGEHGHALTVAGTWAPRRWLRLTAEFMRVDTASGLRAAAGLPSRAIETQFQLVGRVLF
jgi:hypothetical protein